MSKIPQPLAVDEPRPPAKPAPRGKVQPEHLIPKFAWPELETPLLQDVLDLLLSEWRKGAAELEVRRSREKPVLKCEQCGAAIPEGRWKFKDDGYKDPKNGQLRTVYVGGPACTDNLCFDRFQQARARSYPTR